MYKYTTWTDSDGYQSSHRLLPRERIAALLKYQGKTYDIFATIQDYDEFGNVIGCPMYFDIDSSNLHDAYSSVMALVDDLEDDFGCSPLLYFSGSKGFHVVVPRYIRHKRCHEIAGIIAKSYTGVSVDHSVYRRRSMWRCDKTYNKKGRAWKTRFDRAESFSSIAQRAGINQHLTWPKAVVEDMNISDYIPLLPQETGPVIVGGEVHMPICIARLWAMKEPPKGSAHQLATVMVRLCYQEGKTPEETEAIFYSHSFWRGVTRNDYTKIIRSIYRSGNAKIGCANGRDADLMKPYCASICPYNKEPLTWGRSGDV